jgi:HAE1 family hydrophobic/amphiphilic exporter-1
VNKFDFSAIPVMFLGISSELDLSALSQFLEDKVKYRIERVPGVAAADVHGARKREIQIKLKLDRLNALKLKPETVQAAIAGENVNSPAGSFKEGQLETLLRIEGEYKKLEEIANTVVAERNETTIKVSDVAIVTQSLPEERFIMRVNGKNGLMLFVRKQSGINTVDVADAVFAEIEKINSDYSQIKILPIFDTSRFIRDSISSVERDALIGAILATAILFLFLSSFRAVMVIATAIPISIIATFALIYFGGLTLNVMTFGGLALGVGLLVDNSIVVLENIYRRMETGDSVKEASLNGAAEVSDAIAASTLTTVAVFLPLVFFTGVAGVLFRQLAAVVSFSLLCSLGAAAALVPVLTSVFFHKDEMPERDFNSKSILITEYIKILKYSLNHRWLVLIFFAIAFGSSIFILPQVGFELLPTSDEGSVRVIFEGQIGAHIDSMKKSLLELETICVKEVPEAKTLYGHVGSTGYRMRGGNEGEIRLNLVNKAERARSSEEIAASLKKATKNVAGVTLRIRADSSSFMKRAMGTEERLVVEIRGHDLEQGMALAKVLVEEIEKIDGITDARSSNEDGRPEIVCSIDRKKASAHGFSYREISDTLNTLLSGATASQFRQGGDEYRIFLRLDEPFREFAEKIGSYSVINKRGDRIFLRSLISVERKKGPIEIERKNQMRIINIDANFQDRTLGEVATDIQNTLNNIAVPKGFELHLGGEVEEQKEAYSELLMGLILSIVLVYMVMASQFESFLAPFIVMFTMPMGIIGVACALVLTHTPFSINAIMGLIMLAGIVVNDAIVLVDAIGKLSNPHRTDPEFKDHKILPLREAIIEAGERRLRPVLMTTFTTCLALVPIAVGLGEGAEIQAPMGRVVIGGLLSATLITLVVIPILYEVAFSIKNRITGKS